MSDPLAALRPLHLPPPVSWWPPAPGWWLLVLLIVGLVAAISYWRRRTVVRRTALKELQAIELGDSSSSAIAAAVNRLLKRYALACFPRETVASLTGTKWLRFLDENGGSGRFSQEFEQVLLEAPYRSEVDSGFDGTALIAMARSWVKSNKPGERH